MPIDQKIYQNFRMETINTSNSHLLKDLVRHQAMHHSCKCSWDIKETKDSFAKLKSIVDNKINGTSGFFIFIPKKNKPVAYVIYSPIISSQGQGLYMEDICVRPDCRHSGLGLYAISELANIAKSSEQDFISWVVADNNTSGLSFYNKLEAQKEHIDAYFISSSNLKITNDEYLNTTRQLNYHDEVEIRRFCHKNDYNSNFINFSSNHKIIASFDENRNINAISLGSVNTSTFRAVQGIEVSEVLFSRNLEKDNNERCKVHNNLVNRNIDIANKNNLDGHMVWGVGKKDLYLKRDMIKIFNAETLTMTDDSESKLTGHYLSSDQLSSIVRAHKERINNIVPKTKTHNGRFQLQLQLQQR